MKVRGELVLNEMQPLPFRNLKVRKHRTATKETIPMLDPT